MNATSASGGCAHAEQSVKRYNEFDISNKVRERAGSGRLFHAADAQEVNSLRIVVRPHLNRNVAELLADDIERACDFLEKHGGNAKPPKLHAPRRLRSKC